MREKSFAVHWISSKCRENFVVFASSILKVLPLLKTFIGKTFTIHQKPAKPMKFLSCIGFITYGN